MLSLNRLSLGIATCLLAALGYAQVPVPLRLLADKGGLARDLAPEAEGLRTVLRLRSKYGTPQKALTDATKYVDLSYLEKAAAGR